MGFEAWYNDKRPVILVEPTCHEDGPCVSSSDCRHVDGEYIDNKWGVNVTVEQTQCDIVVNYGGKTLSGNILGDSVTVATFHDHGTLQKDGTIKFADGAVWAKRDPAGHRHDVRGKYTDGKWHKSVSVGQTSCDLAVDYGGKSLNGSVVGETICVATFNTCGSVDDRGDIAFADGGMWKRVSTLVV